MCHTWAGRRGDIAHTSHLYRDWLQIWESAHEEWSSCRGLALSKTFFISFSELALLKPHHPSQPHFLLFFFYSLGFNSSLRVSLQQSWSFRWSLSFPRHWKSKVPLLSMVKADNHRPLLSSKDHPSWEVQNYFLFTRCFHIYHSYSASISHCTVTTKYFGKSFTLNILLPWKAILCYG